MGCTLTPCACSPFPRSIWFSEKQHQKVKTKKEKMIKWRGGGKVRHGTPSLQRLGFEEKFNLRSTGTRGEKKMGTPHFFSSPRHGGGVY